MHACYADEKHWVVFKKADRLEKQSLFLYVVSPHL